MTTTVLVPLQGEAVLDRIDEIIRTLGENFFELGEHLYNTKLNGLYKEREHASWEEYCDAALPFQYRKADHYIELWEVYNQKLGYDYQELEHIGWSKLIKVKGLIEGKRDAKKWLKVCEQNGRRKIEQLVKIERAKRRGDEPSEEVTPLEHVEHDIDAVVNDFTETEVPFVDPNVIGHEEVNFEDQETGETIPLHEFKVFLFDPQWANVMAALERCGQLSNSKKPGHLLDLICDEFNQTYVETADGGVAHRLEHHIKELERIYGVKISLEVPRDSELMRMSRIDEPSKKAEEKKKKKSKVKKVKRKPRDLEAEKKTKEKKEAKKAKKKAKDTAEFRW